ncbi:MAG: zinc ribbon domain-containing protein [Gemmatimonadota bacterium]|nr:zinc ribbon domain-containing protein [Gemmatimonadota bacterium]
MTESRMTLTAASRRALLDELFVLDARIDAVPAGGSPAADDVTRYAELRRSYREQLPLVPVSRCPFTQAVIAHSLDPFGIDGSWWDHRAPNRPLELMMQGTVLAFTGALTMDTTIERAPFLVRPGPGAPFVVPRLLARAGVRAVIRSLAIGAHTGYVVMYFANPAPDDLEGYNDWGLDHYQFESDVDRLGWHQGSATARDHDFDLVPYLQSGQLLWIAPNDEAMTLREGVAECPYVDAEGCRVPQYVQDGDRWLGDFAFDDDDVVVIEQEEPEPEDVVEDAVPVEPVAPPVASSRPAERPNAPIVSPAAGCASCGGALKPTSKFCPSCGAPVGATSAPAPAAKPAGDTCRHCGEPRRPDAKFCRSCGKP